MYNTSDPPNFIESEKMQEINNLDINSTDLVPAQFSSVSNNNVDLQQKKLENVQKIIDENNNLVKVTTTRKKKKVRRRRKKNKASIDEKAQITEEIAEVEHSNPRFSKFSKQNVEIINNDECSSNKNAGTMPQASKQKKKIRRRVHNNVEEQSDQQKDENQGNNIDLENPQISQHPIHQPHDSLQNSSKRFRSKKGIIRKENPRKIKQSAVKKDSSAMPNLTNDYNQEDHHKKRSYIKKDNLIPDENARREKDEELLKKRENYNKLKEKKWKEFLKEQEKRKKMIYRSKCTDQVDMFSNKMKIQSQSGSEIQVGFSPRRQPLQNPSIDYSINDYQKIPKKSKKRHAKKKKQAKTKKNIDNVDDAPHIDNAENFGNTGNIDNTGSIDNIDDIGSIDNADQNDSYNDSNNSSARNLIGSAKSRPKVVVPKTMQFSSKKKWNGRSKIPKFVGTQQLSDFY